MSPWDLYRDDNGTAYPARLQVAAGTGTFVVTAVGLRSVQGAIAGADENESDTPLQVSAERHR